VLNCIRSIIVLNTYHINILYQCSCERRRRCESWCVECAKENILPKNNSKKKVVSAQFIEKVIPGNEKAGLLGRKTESEIHSRTKSTRPFSSMILRRNSLFAFEAEQKN